MLRVLSELRAPAAAVMQADTLTPEAEAYIDSVSELAPTPEARDPQLKNARGVQKSFHPGESPNEAAPNHWFHENPVLRAIDYAHNLSEGVSREALAEIVQAL